MTQQGTDIHISLQNEDPLELFDVLGTIGRGNFGQVFRARNKRTGEEVAVKQVPAFGDELITVKKEIETLEKCKHRNIVQYRGTYQTQGSSELWITMEYCVGGSFDNILKVLKRPLTEGQAAFVAKQMLEGLKYLHHHHHIHRDIKGGNVLLTHTGEVKLTDFGVSAQMMTTISKRNSFVGTLHWMAPETIQEKEYDERADIWSLGITIIELLELKPPNFNMHPARLLFHIPRSHPPTLSDINKFSPECHNFLRQCLIKDPEARPTAAELLRDPWLSKHSEVDLIHLLDEYQRSAEGLSTARKFLGEQEASPDPSPRSSGQPPFGASPSTQAQVHQGGEDSSDDPTFMVNEKLSAVGSGMPEQYLQATHAAGLERHLLVDIPLVRLNDISLGELDLAAAGYVGMDTGSGVGFLNSQHHHRTASTQIPWGSAYLESLDAATLLAQRRAIAPPTQGHHQSPLAGTDPGVSHPSGALTSSCGPSPLVAAAQDYRQNASSQRQNPSTTTSKQDTSGAESGVLPKHLTHSTKMLLHCFDYQTEGKLRAGVTETQLNESLVLSEKFGGLLKSSLQI